jgi:hypothetical protein
LFIDTWPKLFVFLIFKVRVCNFYNEVRVETYMKLYTLGILEK